jgi:hypothetical protein
MKDIKIDIPIGLCEGNEGYPDFKNDQKRFVLEPLAFFI